MITTHRAASSRAVAASILVALFLGTVGLLGFGSVSTRLALRPSVECVVDRDALHAPTPRPFHENGKSVLTRSDFSVHGICGGTSGKRHHDVRVIGTATTLRLSGGVSGFRGGFPPSGDVRPVYGERRPHLVLCRLQN